MSDINCGSGGGDNSGLSIRVAAIFVILIGSSTGALFPVFAKRSSWLQVPKGVFECVSLFSITQVLVDNSSSFAKYFGSGVIVGKPALFERETLFHLIFP
jgi:zinc transporter 1/2/3